MRIDHFNSLNVVISPTATDIANTAFANSSLNVVISQTATDIANIAIANDSLNVVELFQFYSPDGSTD